MPSTDPARVRNMSLAIEPCVIGWGTESKPPVIETTCRLPAARRPSLNLRTTGVSSANLMRSGRRLGCCGRYGIRLILRPQPRKKQITEDGGMESQKDSWALSKRPKLV